jgi:hypothetical protein
MNRRLPATLAKPASNIDESGRSRLHPHRDGWSAAGDAPHPEAVYQFAAAQTV